MSEVMRIWDAGAEVYDQIYANNVPYHRSHQAIVDLLPKRERLRVLDLGSGTGLLAQRIVQSVPSSSVTCLDFSAEMIAQARQRLASFSSRIRLACADIAHWNDDDPFDAVVSCNALVYKELDLPAIYARYGGLLRRGGLFLNATVVLVEQDSLAEAVTADLAPEDAGRHSSAVNAFAKGAGAKISHLGEGSLVSLLSIDEHVALLQQAGLVAGCPWRFVNQAVVAGLRPQEGQLPAAGR
jgi:SAM-dependent methyltransferase